MRRTLGRLLPLLLPACMVDTPVVQADRLGEGLEAWCQKTCDRFLECGSRDEPDECVADCVGYFAETYVGRGNVCTQAGNRFMDCVERTSCLGPMLGTPCDPEAEEKRCRDSVGNVECSASFAGGMSDDLPFQCDFGFRNCSDGREYRFSCDEATELPNCDCLVDDEVTGSVTLSHLICPSGNEATQICGWPLGWERPTHCGIFGSNGSAGGSAVSECGIEFTQCSDGHDYAVDCSGPPGPVQCACNVDGFPIGYVESPTDLCAYAAGPDNGSAAANYACGFRIAPVSP